MLSQLSGSTAAALHNLQSSICNQRPCGSTAAALRNLQSAIGDPPLLPPNFVEGEVYHIIVLRHIRLVLRTREAMMPARLRIRM